ncbi:MAG: hypothetical protein IJM99_06800 [Firmicutes bacterium]|nr:hypothetical protein [Bacillota bacterium]
MKKIYILLSRTQSILSKTVHLLTADQYTHAAIAFDEDLHDLYSSARWDGITMFPSGPCQEYLHQGFYSYANTPCAVYELQVDDEVYEQAKAEVSQIIDQQNRYYFNIIGLLLCRMNIPFRRSNRFFCSQFVGEILLRSGALTLPKDPSLLRPSDYMDLPELNFLFQGYTSQLVGKNINEVA